MVCLKSTLIESETTHEKSNTTYEESKTTLKKNKIPLNFNAVQLGRMKGERCNVALDYRKFNFVAGIML